MRLRKVIAISAIGLALAGVGIAPAFAAPKNGSTTSTCNPRKSSCATPDTSAPTVAITSPSPDSTVSGVVMISGSASDNSSVARVEISIDGGVWSSASGTTSWTKSLDTTAIGHGSHTVAARATDASGNLSAVVAHSFAVANSTAPDTSPPAVDVASPTAGATVGGHVAVAGSASDNAAVSRVDVRVDGGSWVAAQGTASWSTSVDTTSLSDGSHTISARATDSSGNVSIASRTISVVNGSTSDDFVLNDPRAVHGVLPLGRTRLPQWESLTGVLYIEQFTNRTAIAFRDSGTGSASYVDLPSTGSEGWANAAAEMTSASELWTFGGTGPFVARRFLLSGAPMPTSATLVETKQLGDQDGGTVDMVVLASGGIVFAWGQEGASGPEGLHVAYRSPSGAWQQLPALLFMPTFASDQVLVQHPADGSIWLFNSPDAWGAIGAVHLTETATGLRVDWTDAQFINETKYGLQGPDPENPNLAVAADPSTGTIALAYQSADRRYFTNGSKMMCGSRIAVARIPASGALSFLVAPAWAERVSAVGLAVRGSETIVSHRPIDEATLTFGKVHVSTHRNGTWSEPLEFGTIASTDRVTYATGRSEFSTMLSDRRIHLRTF